eukprot:4384622-Amphidinium_carterae.1
MTTIGSLLRLRTGRKPSASHQPFVRLLTGVRKSPASQGGAQGDVPPVAVQIWMLGRTAIEDSRKLVKCQGLASPVEDWELDQARMNAKRAPSQRNSAASTVKKHYKGGERHPVDSGMSRAASFSPQHL